MEWRGIKFDWNHARAFLVTAEEGTLSAAAVALGLTQPTLGRQVAMLEKALGVTLFERVGRGLQLTESGVELLKQVRHMGDAAGQVWLAANGRAEQIEGSVCLSASEIHAAYLLPPLIAKLRLLHPGIVVELVASNAPSDLQRGEADIAIRSFQPTQQELIAKKIKDVEAALYATPDYLARLGVPSCMDDLLDAEFVSVGNSEAYLRGMKEFGLLLTQDHLSVRSENHIVHWELTKHGAGIGIAPVDIGDAEPRVCRVLPAHSFMFFPVWLTSHRELQTSRRIRLVFDYLATELA